MVWEPFAIAIIFGLVVSAGLYFIVMWPQVEPDDDDDDESLVAAPAEPVPDQPAALPDDTVAAAPADAPTASADPPTADEP